MEGLPPAPDLQKGGRGFPAVLGLALIGPRVVYGLSPQPMFQARFARREGERFRPKRVAFPWQRLTLK
jgi:hypothetical protein